MKVDKLVVDTIKYDAGMAVVLTIIVNLLIFIYIRCLITAWRKKL